MEDLEKTRLMAVIRNVAPAQPRSAETSGQHHTGDWRRVSGSSIQRLLQTDFSATTHPNPILASAAPLLLTLTSLLDNQTVTHVADFDIALVRAIHQFEHQALARGVASDSVNAARYVLCTVLDEAILATEWSQRYGWAQQSLLQRFHNEANGGDRFYQLLENILVRPDAYIDLLQLCFYCLRAGFSGRLQLDRHGSYKKEAFCAQIYTVLQRHYGKDVGHELLLMPPAVVPRVKKSQHRLQAVAAISLLIFVVTFFGLRFSLHHSIETNLQTSHAAIAMSEAPQP